MHDKTFDENIMGGGIMAVLKKGDKRNDIKKTKSK